MEKEILLSYRDYIFIALLVVFLWFLIINLYVLIVVVFSDNREIESVSFIVCVFDLFLTY